MTIKEITDAERLAIYKASPRAMEIIEYQEKKIEELEGDIDNSDLGGGCLEGLNKGIIEMGIPVGRAGDGAILNLIAMYNQRGDLLKEALIAMDCCTSITWTGKRSNDFMDGSLQSLDITRAKLMPVMDKIETMIGDDDANVA